MLNSRFVRVYIVPGAVFQSVLVAGGYGTGRELVEYFTRFGIGGGLLGILVAIGGLAVVVAATFEFARCFRTYDYRSFFWKLLGPAWMAFEFVNVLLLVLVLAIVASAAGGILQDSYGLHSSIGIAGAIATITALTYFGRDLVTKTLTL